MQTRSLTLSAFCLASAIASGGSVLATPPDHGEHHRDAARMGQGARGLTRSAATRLRRTGARARQLGAIAHAVQPNARTLPTAAREHSREVLHDLVHGAPGALRALNPFVAPAAAASTLQLVRDMRATMPRAFTPDELRAHIDLMGTPPETFTLVIEHDGARREAVVHLPADYATRDKMPLHLNYHGVVMNAVQHAKYTGYAKLATRRGAIAVHPQGTPDALGLRSWNAGGCCAEAMLNQTDDVGFTGALLDQLESVLRVDATRIHASGLSNGGFMMHELAHSRVGERIASFASIAGLDASSRALPARDVPMLAINNTYDPVVGMRAPGLLGANTLLGWPRDAAGSIAGYAKHNGARALPAQRSGRIVTQTFRNARGVDVVQQTVEGASHGWIGDVGFFYGRPVDREAGTKSILDFHDRYALSDAAVRAAKAMRAPPKGAVLVREAPAS